MGDKESNKPIEPVVDDFAQNAKGVVIDGANILSAEPPSVARLVSTIDYARDKGWKVLVGLKEGTYYWMTKSKNTTLSNEEKKLLKKLVESRTVSLIKDSQDDLHLIRIALKGPYYLLSRDLYRDWKKENPSLEGDINTCLMYVEFLGDEVSIDLPPSPHSTMIVAAEPNDEAKIAVVCSKPPLALMIPLNTIIGKNWFSENGVLNPYISRSHFRIIKNSDGLFLEDLKSKNGTFINEMRLSAHHPHPLKDVTSFAVAGEFVLEFKDI